MVTRTENRAEALRLRRLFEDAGAQPIEADILQPAEVLLDLYGEDIRGRAYVTSDALRGEQMLRPDFTVPVVRMHMEDGAEPARYTYAGEVFRQQEETPERANEYLQVGYEVFDRTNPVAADAEVFSLIRKALGDLPHRAATGDIGLLMSAVQGLPSSHVPLSVSPSQSLSWPSQISSAPSCICGLSGAQSSSSGLPSPSLSPTSAVSSSPVSECTTPEPESTSCRAVSESPSPKSISFPSSQEIKKTAGTHNHRIHTSFHDHSPPPWPVLQDSCACWNAMFHDLVRGFVPA